MHMLPIGVSGNQKIGITRLDDSSSSMASASSSARKSSGTIARRQSTQDGADLEVGSVVEVLINNTPCYGVIRWIGEIPEARGKLVAGIEMVTLYIVSSLISQLSLPFHNASGIMFKRYIM